MDCGMGGIDCGSGDFDGASFHGIGFGATSLALASPYNNLYNYSSSNSSNRTSYNSTYKPKSRNSRHSRTATQILSASTHPKKYSQNPTTKSYASSFKASRGSASSNREVNYQRPITQIKKQNKLEIASKNTTTTSTSKKTIKDKKANKISQFFRSIFSPFKKKSSKT